MGLVSGAVGDEDGWDGFVEEVEGFVLGWPKKDVMEPLALGFLAASRATSAALRLRDMMVGTGSEKQVGYRSQGRKSESDLKESDIEVG